MIRKGLYKGEARAKLTCGELVQGQVNEQNFLVTCPLDLYSRATVYIRDIEIASYSNTNYHYPISIISGQKQDEVTKAVLAIRKTLEVLGVYPSHVWLDLSCPVAPGKGMGTSTADIIASARATALCLGKELTPCQLMRLALAIEPSDGTMFEGITLFDHRSGKIALTLGKTPPAKILLFDYGGKVDTLSFNGHPYLKKLNQDKEKEVKLALRKVIDGLKGANLDLIGEGACLSAIAHQSILPKEGLEELAKDVIKMGAKGVVCAHSGTVIGILFSLDMRIKECERYLSKLGCGEIIGEFILEVGNNEPCALYYGSGDGFSCR